MVEIERKRWEIENEGFNRQKNWQGSIAHICSWNDRVKKNHYLMVQISDLIVSFGWQLTKEDIFSVDDYTQPYN